LQCLGTVTLALRNESITIVLLGGDKTDDWTGWYDRNIPLADELYDQYLQEEGLT
jgi:hypothetical protein